ncbi:guanine deaminase [Nocardioides sp. B-3]|nr:guanine deaminase [Nocardioides sp. B-3]UUZ59846.1 guanine deaminase [Nocardioides sp. B-3]
MTLFRGTFLDTPDNPFEHGALRVDTDIALLVEGGVIIERGPYAELRRRHAGEDVVDLTGGLVLPGFIDTHVHFPQARVIGGLGMPLLDWLDRCALPEEARMADLPYAVGVAADFARGLVSAGTTTALVFGAHHAPAVDALFTEASHVGLRVTSGLVVGDRLLRPELHTTPDRAYAESLALAARWHGVGRNRYAVTPRFSLSSTDELLAACGAMLSEIPDAMVTSHVNENVREIAEVGRLFGGASYVDTYARHGLVGRSTVLAHNVHPTDHELALLGDRGAAVAHCPTSNAALGSGLFPDGRAPAARRAGGAGLGRGCRHGVLAAEGGPPGVLRAAAAGRARPPAHRGPPAPPGHQRRRLGAGDVDRGRRPLRRQEVRRPVAAPGRRHRPGRQPRPRR